MIDEQFWKVLGKNRTPVWGGSGQWHPQAWMPEIPDPVPCERGYHLCRRQDLVYWLGPTIWEAKPGDIIIEHGAKVVSNRARLVRRVDTWNPVTARLFAADCAERVLHLFEDQVPGDGRPREAIRTARLFALGEASTDAARAAATAAARYATSAASAAAARAAAASAAESAATAWVAAGAATSAAAASAADAHDTSATAAIDAASAAAHAAGSAAAARAARDARWSGAYPAARAAKAARFAAGDATWAAQTNILFDWLEGRRTVDHVRHELEEEGTR